MGNYGYVRVSSADQNEGRLCNKVKHLGRFTRRTKVVSKSDVMVDLTIRLWSALTKPEIFDIWQNQMLSIFRWTLSAIFLLFLFIRQKIGACRQKLELGQTKTACRISTACLFICSSSLDFSPVHETEHQLGVLRHRYPVDGSRQEFFVKSLKATSKNPVSRLCG